MGTLTRGSSAIGKATSAYKQHQDVANADAKIAGIQGEIEAIQTALEAEIAKISSAYEPGGLALETESIKPAKSDVKVDQVALLWLPCDARGERAW
jgi:phage host-nuclease inhibitor protein Gam